jgi:hypothetical protein
MNVSKWLLAGLLAVSAISVTASTAAKAAPTFQFTVAANSGQIKKMGANRYQLVVGLSAITDVSMFSERPHKAARKLTVTQLAGLWSAGTDSLAKTPPNAVLTVSAKPPIYVTILTNRVENDQVYFGFKLLGKERRDLGALVGKSLKSIFLTIDGDKLSSGQGSKPDFCYGPYAKGVGFGSDISMCCEVYPSWPGSCEKAAAEIAKKKNNEK